MAKNHRRLRNKLTFGTSFKGKRRVAVWLALFALLLQTLLPLGQMVRAAESDLTIFICTPNGIVPLAIYVDAGEGQLPEQDTGKEIAACDVCTPGLFGGHVLTPDAASIEKIAGRQNVDAPATLSWLDRTAIRSLPARGPPRHA
jgi:hypothetical protein